MISEYQPFGFSRICPQERRRDSRTGPVLINGSKCVTGSTTFVIKCQEVIENVNSMAALMASVQEHVPLIGDCK